MKSEVLKNSSGTSGENDDPFHKGFWGSCMDDHEFQKKLVNIPIKKILFKQSAEVPEFHFCSDYLQ